MIVDLDALDLSRLQFGLTAMYHFLFVPLTLGLSILLAIMETVYVMTRRVIWKVMTQFWGGLFGINFAMGVATGVPLEFQFGMNWSYYSHYVGDVFGSLLAIEGMMAFFLEATFVGLFFFGWDRLSPRMHLLSTWLLAIGTNLSALWILIANAWMQYPIGAVFNPETMRMEMSSFYEVFFNPVAQSKVVHTVSAGYVTAALFVLGISAYYLRRGIHGPLARRSFVVAASFGLASALSVIVLGDESGYTAGEHQKMKLAALEAMWETEPAPADLLLFALPDPVAMENRAEVKVPALLGLIATRSFSQPVPGIKDLVKDVEGRVREGMEAHRVLKAFRSDRSNVELRERLQALSPYLGYGLLLKRYTDDVTQATDAMVVQAAHDTIPNVVPLFWAFRGMVGLGFFFLALMVVSFVVASRRDFERHPWLLRLLTWSIPLPYLASELGWFVAEHGRQPWTIEGILPTFLSGSRLPTEHLWMSLVGFVLFYTVLGVVEVWLMVRAVRQGPKLDVPEDPRLCRT